MTRVAIGNMSGILRASRLQVCPPSGMGMDAFVGLTAIVGVELDRMDIAGCKGRGYVIDG